MWLNKINFPIGDFGVLLVQFSLNSLILKRKISFFVPTFPRRYKVLLKYTLCQYIVFRIFEQSVCVAHKPAYLQILNYGNNHLRVYSRKYFQKRRIFDNFHFAQKFNNIIIKTIIQYNYLLQNTLSKKNINIIV